MRNCDLFNMIFNTDLEDNPHYGLIGRTTRQGNIYFLIYNIY